jgi:hypothetical protein
MTVMRDEEQNDEPERGPRIFSLSEAERTRRDLEPVLMEAMDSRKKVSALDEILNALSSRILLMGGMQVPYEKTAKVRSERNRLAESLRASLERISETGCVVKDLDSGLLDFPAIIKNEVVYLCWRLGEDRIRFYHRQDEGFAGRKPLDPSDPGSGDVVH